ncbi:MAG: PAS domain S-box protein, partial [Pseudomonadota bacterium]
FEVQAKALLANHPEMDRILLRDAEGGLTGAVPPLEAERAPLAEAPWHGAFTLAKSFGRVAWSPPFVLSGRGTVVEAHVPVFLDRRFMGMVVGVFPIDGILTHHVPWWVAEKYKVEITDAEGTVLAAKTSVELADASTSHQVRLEPPGHGMGVVATVYRSDPNLARNVLAASIFGLTLVALTSLWAVRRHVHRRLQAELALREEHAFRKAMEDSLTVGMRARDLDGRITYVNPAFCRMVGWSEAELVGCVPPMPYWEPEDIEQTLEMHHRVMRGDAPPDGFEIQFRRRDGERFWALVYEAPLIDAAGRHSGWMASVLDITERKRAEEMALQQQEKLQRTSRLITMGEMASTLAHELNQPLSAIASYNTGCLNKLSAGRFSPAELESALTKLGVQAQRAGQIIRRVHDFVRKSEPNLGDCLLNEVVEDTLGFLEFDAKKRGVAVEVDYACGAPRVEADRILIEQVLLNLARNGMEAMADTPSERRRLSIAVQCGDGQAVVRVADRGHGVEEADAASLFTPFFTTKAEGMGMGLNICRSIIEFHRGRLWMEPNPEGAGAVFLFSLPLKEAA